MLSTVKLKINVSIILGYPNDTYFETQFSVYIYINKVFLLPITCFFSIHKSIDAKSSRYTNMPF